MNEKIAKIKETLKNVDKKAVALTVAQGIGAAVVGGLTVLGAVVAAAAIEGAIQQARDPEAFNRAVIADLEESLKEMREETR